MSMPDIPCRILKILADNAVNTPSPRVMDSNIIAKTLNIELAKTQHLLTALHARLRIGHSEYGEPVFAHH